MTFENWWRSKYDELRGKEQTTEEAFQLMRDAWDAARGVQKKEFLRVITQGD